METSELPLLAWLQVDAYAYHLAEPPSPARDLRLAWLIQDAEARRAVGRPPDPAAVAALDDPDFQLLLEEEYRDE